MKNHPLFLTLLTTIILFSSQSSRAQKFYAGFQVGYHLLQPSSQYVFYNRTQTDDYERTEQFAASLGKGMKAGGSFGFMFKENIGIDLGLWFNHGANIQSSNYVNTGKIRSVDIMKISSQYISISPSVLFQVPCKKIQPYTKFGLIISKGSFKREDTRHRTILSANAESTQYWLYKFYGGIFGGMQAALGAKWRYRETISLFAEVNMISMNYSPKFSTMLAYNQNGVDILPKIHVYDKEIEYLSDTQYDYGPTVDVTKPQKQGSFTMPYSTVGLNLGIIMHLGKKV